MKKNEKKKRKRKKKVIIQDPGPPAWDSDQQDLSMPASNNQNYY